MHARPYETSAVRVGTVRGVPVYASWQVLLFLLAFVLGGSWRHGLDAVLYALSYLLLVGVHEAGHALVVRRRGHTVVAIELHAAHGLCRWRAIQPTPLDRALVAWGGVAAQAALAVVALVTLPLLGVHPLVVQLYTASNLLLAAVNLLPLPGFDGREAWKLFAVLEAEGAMRSWVRTHRRR